MAGITESPFRVIARQMGAGLVFTEMLSAEGIIRNNQKTAMLARIRDEERPAALQIFGWKPEQMAEAARMSQEKFHPDIIDLNFGCPARKILRSRAGSAILKDKNLAKEIILAVKKSVNIPVTVKIRSGWDDKTLNAPEIAALAQECGAEAITVHARTALQRFSGKADWSVIRQVQEGVSIPVIGNGDVKSPEDVKRMMDETRCAGVMIGRAVLGNPWIFSMAKEYLATGKFPSCPDFKEIKRVVLLQAGMMVEMKGEKRGIKEMRKFAAWYFRGFPGASVLRQTLNRMETMEDLHRIFSIEESRLFTAA